MNVISRRALLLALVLGIGVCTSRRAAAASEPRTLLAENEPAARAIGYFAKAKMVDVKAYPSYRRGQSCAMCALIAFGTARQRPCSLVPGRLVEASGWCKAWVLKGSK
jgi:hypothetical protein